MSDAVPGTLASFERDVASLLDTFSARTYRARHLNAGLGLEEALVRSRVSHRRIYDAVVARDPEGARASASAHIASLTGWLRNVLT